MARGQLGLNIEAHFAKHPEAQTVKEVKDALGASSPGAIQYALDKLAGEGKMEKLEGRPAKYRPSSTTGKPVLSEEEAWDLASQGVKEVQAERQNKKVVGRMPCGYCVPGKPVRYHKEHCPGMIPRASAGQDWYCPCAEDDHSRASDYKNYLAEVEADAAERAARKQAAEKETRP